MATFIYKDFIVYLNSITKKLYKKILKMGRRSKKTPEFKISIIVVNHNGLQMTKNCLNTLFASNAKSSEIILVDNNSSDGSKEYFKKLEKKYANIVLISNSTNNGFAEANNQGYRISRGKYVCFLNNDTLVSKNFIHPLLHALRSDPNAAAVQPLMLFPDLTIDSVGSFMTPTGFLYHRAHRQKVNAHNLNDSDVYTLKGACMLWKKSVLQKIGVFDESYFAYFEETDLCHRALNHGYTLRFISESKIIHFGGYTSNRLHQEFVQFFNTKNRITTFRKNFTLVDSLTIFMLHLLLTQGLILKNAFQKPSVAFAMQKGLFQGLFTPVKATEMKMNISRYIRYPDLGYYIGLFSSLKNYSKLW